MYVCHIAVAAVAAGVPSAYSRSLSSACVIVSRNLYVCLCMQNGRHLLFPVNFKQIHAFRVGIKCLLPMLDCRSRSSTYIFGVAFTTLGSTSMQDEEETADSLLLLCVQKIHVTKHTHTPPPPPTHNSLKFYYLFVPCSVVRYVCARCVCAFAWQTFYGFRSLPWCVVPLFCRCYSVFVVGRCATTSFTEFPLHTLLSFVFASIFCFCFCFPTQILRTECILNILGDIMLRTQFT